RPRRHGGGARGPEGVRTVLPHVRDDHEPRLRLMTIEAVDQRARGLRPRREAETVGIAERLRRLDWLLLLAHVGVVAYGLWAIDGITAHDAGGSALTRQALYAFAGAFLFVAVLLVDPQRSLLLRRPLSFRTLAVVL